MIEKIQVRPQLLIPDLHYRLGFLQRLPSSARTSTVTTSPIMSFPRCGTWSTLASFPTIPSPAPSRNSTSTSARISPTTTGPSTTSMPRPVETSPIPCPTYRARSYAGTFRPPTGSESTTATPTFAACLASLVWPPDRRCAPVLAAVFTSRYSYATMCVPLCSPPLFIP